MPSKFEHVVIPHWWLHGHWSWHCYCRSYATTWFALPVQLRYHDRSFSTQRLSFTLPQGFCYHSPYGLLKYTYLCVIMRYGWNIVIVYIADHLHTLGQLCTDLSVGSLNLSLILYLVWRGKLQLLLTINKDGRSRQPPAYLNSLSAGN